LRLRINSVPVVDDDSKLVGIISEKDLLNFVSNHDHWDRPIREIMKTNVVSYEVDMPAAIIWEFLRRVTLRRVVIVDQGAPVGVISRGTLLRWLGNWGALLAQRERTNRIDSMGLLRNHIQEAAAAIAQEAERLEHDASFADDNAVACTVKAATQLQEQAQDLLAMCQVNHQFEPTEVLAHRDADD
jgi:CBS domain-containing protein